MLFLLPSASYSAGTPRWLDSRQRVKSFKLTWLRRTTVGAVRFLPGYYFIWLLLLGSQLLQGRAMAQYTVTTNNDAGAGSLRAAITSGNASGAEYTINITTAGPITLTAALPDITQSCTISSAASLTPVTATGGTIIQRNATTGIADFRLFKATTATKKFTLINLILQNGVGNEGDFYRGGGAVLTDNGVALTMLRCLVRNCTTRDGRHGGGVHVVNGLATLTDCEFRTNSSPGTQNNSSGGAFKSGLSQTNSIVANPEIVSFLRCTFADNSAERGGATYEAGPASFINCTFNSNSADLGGSVYTLTGQSDIINCTFNNNRLFSFGINGATVRIINSLFVNSNLSGTEYSSLGGNVTTTGAGSVFTQDSDKSSQTIVLGSLQRNAGGLVSTLAINGCSPALNAGVSSTTQPGIMMPPTDANNQPRVGQPDAGAYELQGTPGGTDVAITRQPASGSSVCVGSTVTTSVSTSGTVSGYQWYRNGSIVSGQTSATLTLPNTTTANSGSYVAVVTGACNSLTSTAFNLTVNPLPTQYAVTGGGIFCAGGTEPTVGLAGSQTGVNYQLLRGTMPLGTPVAGTGSAIRFQEPVTGGTYTVQATNATTGCQQTMTGSATVNVLLLEPYAVTGGGTYCVGSPAPAVGLAGSQPGVNYQLLRGTTPVGNPVAGTGSAISFGAQSTGGTYTVQAIEATTGCQRTMNGSATVTVNPTPVLTITTPPAVCAPTTVDLTRYVTSDIAATIRFFTDDARTQAVATPTAVAASGTYYVQATSEQGCVSNGSIVVTVNTPPAVSIVPSALTGCAGTIITLSAQGADRYVWNTGATTTSIPVTATGTSVYSVTGTITSTGCSATASQSITIYPLPAAPSVLTQTGQSYPGGQSSVTVDVNSGNVNLVVSGCSGTINWTGPNNTSGTSSPIVVSTERVGQFVYSATCTSTQGCTSPATSATVTVQGRLTVLHRDVDNYADNNAIQPLLVLQNQGSSALPLARLTLRYYVTVENGGTLGNLNVNYAQVGGQNVRLRYVPLSPAQPGASGYVEVSFTAGAGNLAAGANTGPIQAYFAKSDYGALFEPDDYSYNPVRDQLRATQRITAYYDGVLIAGIEPGSGAQVRSVRALTESRNGPDATQINTVLEVRNEGTVAINYSDLKARYYFTSDGNERLQVKVDEGNISTRLVKLPAAVNGADTYLEISYNQGGQLAPGASTGAIRYRISKPDGGRFNQANDYSYQEQPQDRAQNSRLVVLVSNQIVWGTPPTGAPARLAYEEAGSTLSVKVLGNPIQNDQVSFEVTGAEGQALQLQLLTPQGRVVSQQLVPSAEATQRHELSVAGQAGGLFLLEVSTPTQSQTVKVLKAN
ncbi:cellulose binding domain-containing protein [Spirosoma sp. KUDC1026]|uniref:cellulose binding domain-containing protein n=1 Tax=Spirosoma sp. KUDC1026 TaxID=2745947 RepID=UPI00159BDEA0|nr:cellulose binding domain-containing protein [Spirosoma sp. KUDC1026]QKZ12649.1 hypothetical protein HU175_08385 [Spirosoma sp. KUDC1026]